MKVLAQPVSLDRTQKAVVEFERLVYVRNWWLGAWFSAESEYRRSEVWKGFWVCTVLYMRRLVDVAAESARVKACCLLAGSEYRRR